MRFLVPGCIAVALLAVTIVSSAHGHGHRYGPAPALHPYYLGISVAGPIHPLYGPGHYQPPWHPNPAYFPRLPRYRPPHDDRRGQWEWIPPQHKGYEPSLLERIRLKILQ